MPISASADEHIAPLNYFLHSYGPASLPTMHLGWVFVAVVGTIFIIVAFLLILALLKKRPHNISNPIVDEHQAMFWVYIGTGASTFILFALSIYSLITLNAVAKPVRSPALTLTVTGYDWWWKVEYDDIDPNRRFVTANEIHIPVGLPVLVKLKSADVIHAFWVPLLAGKTQTIPGLTNQQWLEADAEGSYRGQCTQYCGIQHAHMGLEVVAQNADKFQEWQNAQRLAITNSSDSIVTAGKQLFLVRCGGCHSIRGTEAAGKHGPDLTHLKSRRMIAAGLITNTPENLLKWITHAQDIKSGARMPSMELTAAETSALSTFLSTLN